MPILKKIHPVKSGDGSKRYRAVWGHPRFTYFFTREELVDLIKQCYALLKGEPHKEWTIQNKQSPAPEQEITSKTRTERNG